MYGFFNLKLLKGKIEIRNNGIASELLSAKGLKLLCIFTLFVLSPC
jgi:hypothetical protein